MGGKSTEENERSQKVKERIEGYQYVIDSAYALFDNKYSIKEIETMPYKELLKKIEKEQELNKALEEEKEKERNERERQERLELERIRRSRRS